MKKLFLITLISLVMTQVSSAQTKDSGNTSEYLLLFRNISGDGKYLVSPDDMQKAMPVWQAWIGGIAKKGKLVATNPIDYNGKLVTSEEVKDQPYLVKKELVVGYLILKASTLEEAIEISKTSPIITEYNGSVEVRAMIPFQ
jgi:YCII-related domain